MLTRPSYLCGGPCEKCWCGGDFGDAGGDDALVADGDVDVLMVAEAVNRAERQEEVDEEWQWDESEEEWEDVREL